MMLPRAVIDELLGRFEQIGTPLLAPDDDATEQVIDWLKENPVQVMAFVALSERAFRDHIQAMVSYSALLTLLGVQPEEKADPTPFFKKLVGDEGA